MTEHADLIAAIAEGTRVHAEDGSDIGKVIVVYNNEETNATEWIGVATRTNARPAVIPVAVVCQDGDALSVPFNKARIAGAPKPAGLGLSETDTATLYEYYDVPYVLSADGSGADETSNQNAVANVRQTAGKSAHPYPDVARGTASDVTQTAKDQAGQVISDAQTHAHHLLRQALDQVTIQAEEQTQRLSATGATIAEQLRAMTDAGTPGTATHALAREGAQRADAAARYLDGHSPEHIAADLTRFARRRPGAFIVTTGLAGLLTGRLLRSGKDSPRRVTEGLSGDRFSD